MYITNITDDYNDTLSLNINCTNSENNIEIVISLITIIPSGMSLICLISLMAYTLVKLYITKNKNTYNYSNIYTYYSYMSTCNYTRKYLSTYTNV